MGLSWAEHSVEIDAPIETSFDAIVDYESFPRWQNAVDSVEVLDRTKDGLGRNVKLYVDAKVRKIDYTLRYSYDRPTKIEWDFVSGNGMRDVDGVYTLEELSPERSRATYKLGADPAIPVPGPVARRVHKQLVKRSVEDLKREAERRHAEGGGASEKPKRRFGLSRDKTEEPTTREPTSREPTAEWAPKAVRSGAGAPGRGSGEPRDSESRLASVTSIPGALIGGALSLGRDAVRDPVGTGRRAAEDAVRAGRDAAEMAIDLARDAVDRVDRRLSGRDDDD
jgi:ribosome-associated toxin RatA of RatAB toxin-antitoxin module